MKTNTVRAKLLNCFFAFTLVFGLCIPSIGTYAYAEPVDEATTNDVAVQVEGNDTQGENQSSVGDTNNLGDGDQDESNTNDTDNTANNGETENSDTTETEQTEAATTQADEIVPMAADSTVGGLTISGGTVGTDFTHAANLVVVKTSTPLTLKGTFTGSVQIQQGTSANITLNGVTITANSTSSPINLMSVSSCNIVLPDNSVNTLDSGAYACAALHCGQGSTLIIDDSVLNIDTDGNMITPVNGVIGADLTLQNGTELKAGDPLTRLNGPEKPEFTRGNLIAKGGKNSSAIGAGPSENSGKMVFNGGMIKAYSWGGNNTDNANKAYSTDSPSSGSGIGGGAGSGGGTETIFNSATVEAYASYHGAGIGAGWSSGATTKQEGSSSQAANGVCGNITINGGYIKSRGYDHGNAFGEGCNTKATGCTILITGGTLLPTSASTKFDIGGTGGDVIITGGSVNCNKNGDSYKFQGNAGNGVAYGAYTVDNGIVKPVTSNKVKLVTINVSGELEAAQLNSPIEKWRLLVGGEQREYGAPSMFDEGKLYLWLSEDDAKKRITVDLSYDNGSGEPVDMETMETDPNSGGAIAKKWIVFRLEDQEEAQDYLEQLNRPYNGLPLETYDLVKHPIVHHLNSGRDVPLNTFSYNNAVTGAEEKVAFSYQEYDQKGDVKNSQGVWRPIGNTIGNLITTDQAMPSDVGIMKFIMESKQYANDSELKDSFWGHQVTGWCEITPVDSSIVSLKAAWGNSDSNKSNAFDTLVVAADITSAEGTANTCKSPQGQVEIVVDGNVVETVDLNFNTTNGNAKTVTTQAERDSIVQAEINKYHGVLNTQSVSSDNEISVLADDAESKYDGYDGTREHTIFTHAIQVSKNDYLMPLPTDGNKHEITVNFKNSKNYNRSNGVEDNNLKEEVEVEQVTPGSDIDDPDGGEIEEKDPGDDPNPGPGGDDSDNPVSKELVKNYTMTGTYGAGAGDAKNEIAFTVKSPSYGKFSPKTSNGAVVDVKSIDLVKDENGQPVKDANGNLSYKVVFLMNSAGASDLVLEQEPSGAYAKSTFNIDTTIFPNPGESPEIKVTVNERNLGNPEDPDAKLAPEGMAAPGDVIEYTITADNLVAGTAWQNAELSDVLSNDVTIDPESIEVAINYPTPSDKPELDDEGNPIPNPEPTWIKPDNSSVEIVDGKIVFKPGVSVYGDQSVSIRFKTKVKGDTADRNTDKNNPIKIENNANAQGTYGVNENPATNTTNPGVSHDVPEANITPGAADPVTIIPNDVSEGQLVTTKTVENLSRNGGGALVHDVLKYTINATNETPDSCLYDAFIIDKLPKGLIYKPGTLQLVDAEGNESQVPDSAFNANLNALGFYVGDIYYGENVIATFEAEVGPEATTESIANIAQASGEQPSDKYDPKKDDEDKKDPSGDPDTPGENPGDNSGDDDGDDPDSKKPTYPNNPVDPSDPGKKPHYPNNPTDPSDPDKKPTIPTDPADINKNIGGVPDPDSNEDPKPNKPSDPTKPSVNVDLDGDGMPDVNIDTDGDGDPDLNIVDEDSDGIPDYIDLQDPENPVDPDDPKTWPKPTTNIDNDYPDGDLIPDVNVDADGDGKPDVNIDTDGDGDPDLNIDTDRDGIPDVNVDTNDDGKPDVNIDTDNDGNPDSKLDEDRNGVPDENEKPKENKPGDSFWGPDNKDMTEDELNEFIQSLPIKGENADPAQPDSVLSADPEKDDLRITLSAKNETRTDGYTYVGDEVTYTITIENLSSPEKSWLDVIARADIPEGLKFMPGSVYLTAANGEVIHVDDSVYNDLTRILALNAGDLAGGQTAKVVFKAEVTIEALNKDIGMTSYAYATLPSEFDVNDESYVKPELGSAFVPAEGWEAFANTHVSVSNPEKVYPSEKVSEKTPPLPNTPEEAEQAAKLAKTSDFMGFAALGIGTIAIVAAVALIMSRKRIQKNK